MLTSLKTHSRFNETLFLATLTLFCFSLSIFRLLYTDSKMFLFLNWNLFLAFIPWALSSMAVLKPGIRYNRVAIAALLFTWVLFFPNAPYILTDLFHLRGELRMPIWFDLVLILSFAWTGLLFGFLSLWDIEKILRRTMRPVRVTILSVALLFLGSFGIYVGRYLRWNSWDIITEPFGLMYDIGDKLINPFRHPRTWGVTICMGLFLNMIYWSFRLIRKRDGGPGERLTSSETLTR